MVPRCATGEGGTPKKPRIEIFEPVAFALTCPRLHVRIAATVSNGEAKPSARITP